MRLFNHAIEIAPSYGEALNNLGLVLTRLGRHDEAAAHFQAACRYDPRRADWANNLANNEVERFHFQAALSTFDRALSLQPDNNEFWNGRALALRGLRRQEDALASLHRSLALNPTGTNALSNLGVMLREEKRLAEAIAIFERAVESAPDNPAVYANFASVFELTGEYDRVRELAERALALDPDFAEPYVLLANCELEAARYARSRELLERALSLDPANRNARWNIAILSLLHGDFANGWRQFEARKQLQSSLIDHASYNAPEWDGTPLAGRSILLHTEQGIGDALQFVRFAALLAAHGAGRVIVECPHPLVSLLMGVQGVDEVVARGSRLPPYDVHAFLMSLPFLLDVRPETIPANVPYLIAGPRPAAALIDAPANVLKVGIVWAGNPAHHRDRLRSVAPERFIPLLSTPNTAWYSLQKGDDVASALEAFPAGAVKDVGIHLNDFRDTAAVLQRLDLVITVDTSVAHLAGALGRPTWVLLPCVPDFRWMLERSDSPWYPTVRLFRQPAVQQWDPVFLRVADALGTYDRGAPGSADTPAWSDGSEPVTTLESVDMGADGRPRFDLWIPLAQLADPAMFEEYQAELLDCGHEIALRRFWDEALAHIDTFVDDAPGLGLTMLSVLTAPHRTQVIARVPDGLQARRLSALANGVNAGDRVSCAEHIEPTVLAGRVAVRCASATALHDLVAAFAGAGRTPSLHAAAIHSCPPASVRDTLNALAACGHRAFEATLVGGEVALDPIVAWERPQDIVVLSAAMLAELIGEASDGRATAVPLDDTLVVRDGPAPRCSARTSIGIDWELRPDTGWGVYGTHLALELAARSDVAPMIFASDLRDAVPIDAWRLRQVPTSPVTATGESSFDGLMLKALGNNLAHGPLWERVRGRREAGVIFFEDTAFDPQALARARSLDCIVAGSEWNAQILRALGLANVVIARQGVDTTVFHRADRSGRLADRFVVFSGGKLEFRKGQDLVVAAVRRFRERYPETLLVTAWHNHWPQLIADLSVAGHVVGVPDFQDGMLAVASWLEANGIPRDAILDVGRVPNALMGHVVREADVALFPNRAEGGTNLVAMECMAAGVPTIISGNTGHLDLVAAGGCIPLVRQLAVPRPTRFFRGTDGWGESDVDEIVDVLQQVWDDRAGARAIGAKGADVMRGWCWRDQVDRLVTELRPLL